MFGTKTRVCIVLAALLLVAGCGKHKPMTLKAAQELQAEKEALDLTDPQYIYLQENAKKEGVIVRPSGLQIRVVNMGDGDIPTKYSMVTAHYQGTLIDGTVFDSTQSNGQPFTFTLDSVIDGWKEALMLMRVGSIFEIVIPADLAYGKTGAGDAIPPGATLVFEVELVGVTQPLKPAG